MQCPELVIHDHLILRRGLDIFDAMVQKLEAGERIEIADATTVLKFLRYFSDEYHQVLPEHADPRTLVAGIENALSSRRASDFVNTSRRLSLVLRNHVAQEDRILREISALSFTPHHKRPDTDADFSRLERKREIARTRSAAS